MGVAVPVAQLRRCVQQVVRTLLDQGRGDGARRGLSQLPPWMTAEDKARVAEMRNRLAGWARDDFTAEETAWLDGLWCAATPAIARASEPG